MDDGANPSGIRCHRDSSSIDGSAAAGKQEPSSRPLNGLNRFRLFPFATTFYVTTKSVAQLHRENCPDVDTARTQTR